MPNIAPRLSALARDRRWSWHHAGRHERGLLAIRGGARRMKTMAANPHPRGQLPAPNPATPPWAGTNTGRRVHREFCSASRGASVPRW